MRAREFLLEYKREETLARFGDKRISAYSMA